MRWKLLLIETYPDKRVKQLEREFVNFGDCKRQFDNLVSDYAMSDVRRDHEGIFAYGQGYEVHMFAIRE